jgi:hypothetical protein
MMSDLRGIRVGILFVFSCFSCIVIDDEVFWLGFEYGRFLSGQRGDIQSRLEKGIVGVNGRFIVD